MTLQERIRDAVLDLSNEFAGDQRCRDIAVTARQCEVETLILSGNNIGNGLHQLCDLLANSSHLKSLCLEWNSLGSHLDACACFCRALSRARNLTALDLRNNRLGCSFGLQLAAALRTNTTLRSIDLRWNDLGDEGAAALCDALHNNNVVMELQLAGNGVNIDIMTQIETALKRNELGLPLPSGLRERTGRALTASEEATVLLASEQSRRLHAHSMNVSRSKGGLDDSISDHITAEDSRRLSSVSRGTAFEGDSGVMEVSKIQPCTSTGPSDAPTVGGSTEHNLLQSDANHRLEPSSNLNRSADSAHSPTVRSRTDASVPDQANHSASVVTFLPHPRHHTSMISAEQYWTQRSSKREQQVMDVLRSQVEAMKHDIVAAQRETARVEEQLEAKREDLAAAERDLKAEAAAGAVTAQRLRDLELASYEEKRGFEERLSAVNQQLEDLRAELRRGEQTRRTAEKQHTHRTLELSQQIAQLREELADAVLAKETADAQAEQYKVLLEQKTDHFQQHEQELRRQLSDVQERLASQHQDAIKTQSDQQHSMQTTIEQLQQKIATLQNQCADQKSQIHKLSADLQSQAVEADAAAIEQVRQVQEDWQKRWDEAQEAQAKVRAALGLQVKTLEERVEAQQRSETRWREAVGEAESKHARQTTELTAEIARLTAETEAQRTALADQTTAAQEAARKATAATQRAEAAQERLQALQEAWDGSRAELVRETEQVSAELEAAAVRHRQEQQAMQHKLRLQDRALAAQKATTTEKFSAFEASLSEKVSSLMRTEVDKLLAGLMQPVESPGRQPAVSE